MKSTVAFVLAGGTNRGFSVLTDNRAKSAMPIFGHYRVIDFAISNLAFSGVRRVGVIIQYLPGSLIDHIGIGQAYDYDAANRSIRLMPPFVGAGQTEWFRGTADAIYQNFSFVRDNRADQVLVLSGDHVYNMDYGPLVVAHRESNADLTVVTRRRPANAPATMFGYVQADADKRVRQFVEKPATPPHDTISMGIYLFDADVLWESLERLQRTPSHHNLPIDVVTPLVENGRVFEYPFDGEWDYLANLESYCDFHWRALAGECILRRADWQVTTNLRDRQLGSRPSPYFGPASCVSDSMISPGCVIEGTVMHSVLSPGVYVAPGAMVKDSILFHDCRVHEGARLEGVVSDKDAVFHEHCRVGDPDAASFGSTGREITVVGKSARVLQGVRVGVGAEIALNATITNGPGHASEALVLRPLEEGGR